MKKKKRGLLEGLLFELKNAPPLPRQSIAFHGTRAPTKQLRTKGLVFDTAFYKKSARQFAAHIGIDFNLWSKSRRGDIVRAREKLDSGWRKGAAIWVSANIRTARNYAHRNPEILYDVISSMWHFKHPRRESKKFYKEIRESQKTLLSHLGTPKLVTIDLKAIGIKPVTRMAVNVPLKRNVPPDAILRIVMLKEE